MLRGSRPEHAQDHRDLHGMVNRLLHDSVEHRFVGNSCAPKPVSPKLRWENSESSLRAVRDFGSSGRRVRSRESAARPIPFRAPNAGSDCYRRCFEFFRSKGVNAEAVPKLKWPLEWVALSQVQPKSLLTAASEGPYQAALIVAGRGKNRRFVGSGSGVLSGHTRTIAASPVGLVYIRWPRVEAATRTSKCLIPSSPAGG